MLSKEDRIWLDNLKIELTEENRLLAEVNSKLSEIIEDADEDDPNWWEIQNEKAKKECDALVELNAELSKIIEQYKKDQSK